MYDLTSTRVRVNHMTGNEMGERDSVTHKRTCNSKAKNQRRDLHGTRTKEHHICKQQEWSNSENLSGLFLSLFPLGIPTNLHLGQLDVADDVGV